MSPPFLLLTLSPYPIVSRTRAEITMTRTITSNELSVVIVTPVVYEIQHGDCRTSYSQFEVPSSPHLADKTCTNREYDRNIRLQGFHSYMFGLWFGVLHTP